MKCVIGTANVKDFGKAIHSLAKIGDELYIEPKENGLSLRTVSSARSAYFTYDIGYAFFIRYDSGLESSAGGGNTGTQDTARCKVAMKAVVGIFKGVTTLDRTIQRCKMTLKWDEFKLVIQVSSHYGIVKTHNLSFIECDALQAVYDNATCPNFIVTEPKVLLDAMSSFHQSTVEEVTFCFAQHNLVLKSHVDEPDPSKVVHTVVTLANREFEDYAINEECELTVCLKEVKSLLSFIGGVGIATKAYFSGPGSPIIFTFDSKPLYEGTLVLATLGLKPDARNDSRAKTNNNVDHRGAKKTNSDQEASFKTRLHPRPNERTATCTDLSEDHVELSQLDQDHDMSNPDEEANVKTRFDARNLDLSLDHDSSQVDRDLDQESVGIKSRPNARTGNSDQMGLDQGMSIETSSRPKPGTRKADPDQIGLSHLDQQDQESAKTNTRPMTTENTLPGLISDSADHLGTQNDGTPNVTMPVDERNHEESLVASSPPSKRSRFYFRRCFESTFNPDMLPGHDIILAEDSDED